MTMERRDFVKHVAVVGCACAAGGAAVPFIRSMSPALDMEAQRTVEVDISRAVEGTPIVVEWQGKPVFILKRTAEMIETAKKNTTIDPAEDSDRVKKPEWLIVEGVCKHLGCTPEWEPAGDRGWWCHCHGSQYDLSGRAIVGPTPQNLAVPYYEFIDDKTVLIGKPKPA